MMNFSTSKLALLAILVSFQDPVNSRRFDFYQNEQPESVVVHHNYHWLIGDRSYHYLNSAGISNHSTVERHLLEAAKVSKGFEESSAGFHSNDYFSKIQSLKWYFDCVESTAIHNYDDPNDIKLAAGPQVNQQLCGLQLDYMLHMINKDNHHITNSTDWSIFNMINSFGSPTFGIASGNTMFLGDYKACTSYKLSINKNELAEVDKSQAEKFFRDNPRHTSDSLLKKVLNFAKTYIGPFIGITETVYDSYDVIEKYQDKIQLQPTVYCMAGLRWPSWPNSTYHKRNVVLRVGVCLPDTCDSSSLDFYSDKIKRLMDIQIPDYYSGYYINNLYCLPDEKSPLRNPMNYTLSLMFICFNIMWMVLIVSATIAVYLKSKQNKNKIRQSNGIESESTNIDGDESSWFNYLKCWCIINNYSAFINASGEKRLVINCEDSEDVEIEKTHKNRVDLSSLDGLKIVGFIAVVTAHSLIFSFLIGWDPLEFAKSFSITTISGIFPFITAMINFFFVITGIITSIRLLQMPKETLMTPVFWLQFFVYRYLRIVPLYLFIHWAMQSYGRFFNLGPLWDYGTSETGVIKRCQSESIWEVVFLMANFKSPPNHCNPVGWYLASDLQFSLITPLFIILFLKRPYVGHLTVLVTSLTAMVNHIRYYTTILPQTDGYLNFPIILTYAAHDGGNGHVQPQYRCLSYFIGLSAGHILLQYGRGEIKQWPSWFVSLGKAYICLELYSLYFAGSIRLVLQDINQPLLHFLGAIYGGALNFFSSIAIAVFIMLLCTGYFPTMNNLLSKNYLKVLSASILSPVLIHLPILGYGKFSLQTLPHISLYLIAIENIVLIAVSLLFGSILYIVYELPTRRFLIKSIIIMLGGRKSKKTKFSARLTEINTSKGTEFNN